MRVIFILHTYNEPRFIFCEIVLMQTFFRFFKNVPRVNTTKHKLFVLATCVCLLLTGALLYIPDVVHVSSSVSGRELPIYCVQTDKPQIALTFDAAWGNEDTKQILSILEKHQVSATFFMTGGWVSSYPQDVTAIFEAGHDLGNHSENHKNMSKLSTDEMTQELSAVHERVKELTGQEMLLFRPPYGDYSNEVIQTAASLGYYTIQWDVDSLDWKDYGVDSIIDTVTNHKHLGNGSIILCHNGAKYTADALDTLIQTLKKQGYEFVKVSDLIYKDHYSMNVEGRQIPNGA